MAPKSTSHRLTLEQIKQSRAGRAIAPDRSNPAIACRREFRREPSNQRVEFTLLDSDSSILAWGTATLIDYCPNGAQLGELRFDEGFWPDGDFRVTFRVTGGPYEGVEATGVPLRFAASRANLALRFDGLYVKL